MSARARLPHRRPSVVTTVAWTGKDWPVCFGFDGAGQVREVFLKGAKTGSTRWPTISAARGSIRRARRPR